MREQVAKLEAMRDPPPSSLYGDATPAAVTGVKVSPGNKKPTAEEKEPEASTPTRQLRGHKVAAAAAIAAAAAKEREEDEQQGFPRLVEVWSQKERDQEAAIIPDSKKVRESSSSPEKKASKSPEKSPIKTPSPVKESRKDATPEKVAAAQVLITPDVVTTKDEPSSSPAKKEAKKEAKKDEEEKKRVVEEKGISPIVPLQDDGDRPPVLTPVEPVQAAKEAPTSMSVQSPPPLKEEPKQRPPSVVVPEEPHHDKDKVPEPPPTLPSAPKSPEKVGF